MSEVWCRAATAEDVEAIARLHAQSWRDDYRGIYADAFLDGDLLSNRRAVWGQRLTEADPNRFTVLAEDDSTVVGFIHVILDADHTWGAVVQNLHVARHVQRQGIGSRLMAEGIGVLRDRRPASGLYVLVREDNTRARAFYEARRGADAGRDIGGPFPDGSRAPVLRYVWRAPLHAEVLLS